MKLNELSPKEGSVKDRTRVGRGIGSGKGKTGGRGVKGQKSRSGVSVAGFEGGQMPIYRRLPKRGFTNIFAKKFNEVSVERIQKAIDAGKLEKGATVDVDALLKAGVVRRKRDGVRLLGNGEIKDGITLEVNYATKSAAEKVEKAGGSVKLLEPKEKTAE
ncbi:50S ribosomal protein L15 [Notoacmeibacter sp. MSK16QG-6]|uniref:50S ribosomal protein L15 n=1 Tax=Notoacmeibacter sp. MSK16QG-6 TaxID=2957982 RepID=UPI00209EF7C1|nr:50S ribosomal protein L15 [Notoacmeibacter sp. MSK16QG-6]MCP1200697.1 50S ribosomal protein L15 [Notoacmeibacter sp. MSK16QG-6]